LLQVVAVAVEECCILRRGNVRDVRGEVWSQTAGEKKRGSAVSSALQRRERVRVVFFTEDAMRAKGAGDQVIGRSGWPGSAVE
jgi:hypothetical protein